MIKSSNITQNFNYTDKNNYKICVIGLGYVGLPVFLLLSKKFNNVVGFDISEKRISELKKGIDSTGELSQEELEDLALKITSDDSSDAIRNSNFYIVTVPTPVDINKNPDFDPLISACTIIGKNLSKGDIVVFESTVYPGVTEDICGVELEKISKLIQGRDFKLGYSPERINPGDKEHTLSNVVKVVSGEDESVLKVISFVYTQIVEAGVFEASSIKVAEAAKVIENTQRDINVALMNELSIIFDLMNIRTSEVLKAANTKWNFLKFSPGLVGGHCIGVDPYYLTNKAQQLGYHPQVILSGRRINDDMGKYVARKLVKLLVNADLKTKGARVGVLGVTFKENVSDLRNSRMPDLIKELEEFGVIPIVHDPLCNWEECFNEYGIKLCEFSDLSELDAVIYGVPHNYYSKIEPTDFYKILKSKAVIIDIKSALKTENVPENAIYWSL